MDVHPPKARCLEDFRYKEAQRCPKTEPDSQLVLKSPTALGRAKVTLLQQFSLVWAEDGEAWGIG